MVLDIQIRRDIIGNVFHSGLLLALSAVKVGYLLHLCGRLAHTHKSPHHAQLGIHLMHTINQLRYRGKLRLRLYVLPVDEKFLVVDATYSKAE